MERPLQFIGDITNNKDLWKLAVKIKAKWSVVKDGKEHLEMLIVDSKGNDIQVIIPTAYKPMVDKILQENSTYTISNFNVLNNDLPFKASEHKYKLKWTGGTAVDVDVHNIPSPGLKFKPFAEILTGKWKADLLVHVIGVVQDMGFCQLTEGTGKKLQVNFTMKDLSLLYPSTLEMMLHSILRTLFLIALMILPFLCLELHPLASALRSKHDIVLTVATSGIASLLLPGGRTAHSKFKMPVPTLDNSTCNIAHESDMAKLLRQTKLIIYGKLLCNSVKYMMGRVMEKKTLFCKSYACDILLS